MSRVTSSARWLAPLAGLLIALLLPAPGSAQTRVYKWVDDDGQAHYTLERSEIPPSLRQRLRPGVVVPTGGEEPAGRDEIERTALEEIRPAFGAAASVGSALPEPPSAAADEISELEAQIRRDREALKDLVSRQGLASAEFTNDPRVREIAERLPRLQAELEALRREAAP
jgi:hypothetical protein